MKRIANKVLSCILALTMVVSMVPSQAFATDVEDEAETDSVLAGCFDVEFEAEDGTEQTEASDSGRHFHEKDPTSDDSGFRAYI